MRKINSTLFFFLFIIVLSATTSAQVSLYTFAQSNGTYTEITGGTSLGTTTTDDQYFVNPAIPAGGFVNTGEGFPIGFNFTYNGIVFDRFGVNANGWIALGQSSMTPSVSLATTSAYTPLASTATNTPNYFRSRIAGMGRDIQAQAGAELRFQTIGTAPNRQLVVQWKNYKRFGTAGTGDGFNFQIILSETTNTVQVKYGTIVHGTGTTVSTVNHTGLGGTTAPDFNNRQTVAPHNWNNSIAGTANTQGLQNATSTIAVTPPVPGLTFTWSPPTGPNMVTNGSTLVSESCLPANNAIDAGETVTVSLCLQNTGVGPSTNLVGTLQATGGVTNVSGPQNYGAVAPGATVCRDFTFLSSGICGGTITATLQLQDGANNLGTVTYTYRLGLENVSLNENFDAVVAPALPAGWTATQGTNIPGSPPFVTSNSGTPAPAASSAPNALFTQDPANILDNMITTPAIAISSANAQVTFRNNYSLETNFDGAVLEISLGAGPFVDILAAGGSFVTGGYNGTISAAFGNPIGGRQAWTGTSAGGFITTTANLPAAANGQSIRLRFRMGSDNSFAGVGWRIDDVKVVNGYVCCTECTITCPANITVNATAGQCGAIVNYPAPTSSGNCGTVSTSPASGTFFPVGTTTVTSTSTVGGGYCTFTITVVDNQAPTITCPANITRNNDPGQCGAVVTWTTPVSTDNCPGTVVVSSPASGSSFPVGTTTVNVTATDASGNTTSCSFTVTVVDNQAPFFGSLSPYPERLYYKFDGTGGTVPNLASAPPAGTANGTLVGLTQGSTGKCGAALIGTGATGQHMNTGWATNLTAPWTISFWLGPNQPGFHYLFGDASAGSFRAFRDGAAGTNNMLVRGGSGDVLITGVNPAATFVTIVYNGTNTVVYKNGASPQTYAVTFTNTSAGPFLVGGYGTAASINGRMDEFSLYSRALSATEVLNLFNTCPTSATSCPANITVNNAPGTCGAVVNYTAPVGADNCPGATTTQIAGLASGATYPVGVTTNTFRVVDAAGNSTLCSFTVTVMDNQPPAITCPANMTVNTPIGSCTAVVSYTTTATDNCGQVTVNTTPASGTTFALGTHTITSVATDAAGNTSTCSFTVTVRDGQLPVISAQPANRFACVGTNAVFSVTSSNVVTYQWQSWNGTAWVNIAGANSSTHTINNVSQAMNTNTFRVVLTGLCTTVTSGQATLFVHPLPNVTLTTSIPPQLIPGQSLNLMAQANPGGGSYAWTLNGQPLAGASGATLTGLTVNNLGTYRVTYTDPNGCVRTSADLVISALATDNLWIYPNPNRGQFQVRYFNSSNDNVTINVYDEKGSRVYSSLMPTTTPYSQLNVNVTNRFAAGKYLVEVVSGAGERVGAKWIVINSQ